MAVTTTTFGKDTSCTTSLKSGRFVSGVRLVAEAAYRRLTTPRGMLRGGEEEANYGLDLAALIGSTASRSVAAALPGRIDAELRKDERIQKVDVTVLATGGKLATYHITIKCETAAGPFTLQVVASDVTVELLGISEAA